MSSLRLPAVALLVMVLTASCAGNKPPPNGTTNATGPSSPGATAVQDVANPSSADGYPSAAARDAQWTLLCNAIAGDGHVERARRVKAELAKIPGLPHWYLVHKENETELYYGYYKDFNSDTPEGKRAQADRKKIGAITSSDGGRLFANATFVPLPAPDPPAPPEWNLVNADGYWSLQIAAYSGHPQRKQFAVDSVREARKSGIEAYYYHGDSVSSVCIGAWPEEAVVLHDAMTVSHDPDQSIYVIPPGQPEPEGPVYDRYGREMLVVKPRLEIRDPAITRAMTEYQSHAVNGEVMMVKGRKRDTGEIVDVPRDRSFLIRIPRDDAAPSLLDGPLATDGVDRPDLLAPNQSSSPSAPPSPGAGRLRSIGD